VGDSQRAGATVEAVKKIGRRSIGVQLDQRDSNSVDSSVKKVMAEFGRLDVLVNNAGWKVTTTVAADRLFRMVRCVVMTPSRSWTDYRVHICAQRFSRN
jgi:NAD(P)-dependent dehydrogenase (short-subunit alcohol dehydrogenase family)